MSYAMVFPRRSRYTANNFSPINNHEACIYTIARFQLQCLAATQPRVTHTLTGFVPIGSNKLNFHFPRQLLFTLFDCVQNIEIRRNSHPPKIELSIYCCSLPDSFNTNSCYSGSVKILAMFLKSAAQLRKKANRYDSRSTEAIAYP